MKTKKTQSKSSKLSVGQKLKESSQLYLLMLPSIIIFLIFTYYPMYGVIIAFKDFKPALGIMGSKWVGMKNFITFFKSYQFSVTIKNTIVISLYTIAVTFPLPIIMALMVNQIRSMKFKKFLQVATYLPHFISVVVMSGMIILFLSPSTGIIAKLVGLLGFKLPNLMGSASAFPHIYVWTEAWQHVGWDSILYIATLSSVDPSLYEAALDLGATPFYALIHVIIPQVASGILSGFVMAVTLSLDDYFVATYTKPATFNTISTYVVNATKGSQTQIKTALWALSTIIFLFVVIIEVVMNFAPVGGKKEAKDE